MKKPFTPGRLLAAAAGPIVRRTCLLLLFLTATASVAQAQYYGKHREDDGFVWERIQEGSHEGALNEAGKVIVPAKFRLIVYHASDGGYFSVIGDNECYGCYDKNGNCIIPTERKYSLCFRHSTDDGRIYYMFEKDGKKNGVCDASGREIIAPGHKGIIYSDNTFQYQTDSGNWVEMNMSLDSKGLYAAKSPGSGSGGNGGNNTPAANRTSSGTSASSSAKSLFELAYNTPDSDTQTKINRYIEVMKADANNREGFHAVACNNIGVICEKLGDYKNAKAYFERAVQLAPSWDTAQQNLKLVKRKLRGERLNLAANILGAVGNSVNNAGAAYNNTNSYTGGGSSYSGSSGSSSGSSAGEKCSRCLGSGKCSSRSGTADRYYCHGSGKCGYCSGKGWLQNLGQTIKCNSCNGTGTCRYCSGSGKCQDCHGSGRK